jgi:hypothetical protein
MKPLKVRIVDGIEDWYLRQKVGQEIVIKKISSHCGPWGDLQMRGVTADGDNLLLYSNQVEPLDVSDVPQSHMKSLVLRQAWVFSTAKNDAWNREPPRDLKAYEEENGVPWKDERVWDVGRM